MQRQEQEQDLSQRNNKLQAEKQAMNERMQSLQRALTNMETEKREMDRSHVRLEKDKTALRKTLDKVRKHSFVHQSPQQVLYVTVAFVFHKMFFNFQ